MSLQASRGANATLFLGVVIAVWVAARFSSVAVEKGANALAKVIMTLFAFSVLPFALVLINGERTSHYAKIFNQCCANHFTDKRL